MILTLWGISIAPPSRRICGASWPTGRDPMSRFLPRRRRLPRLRRGLLLRREDAGDSELRLPRSGRDPGRQPDAPALEVLGELLGAASPRASSTRSGPNGSGLRGGGGTGIGYAHPAPSPLRSDAERLDPGHARPPASRAGAADGRTPTELEVTRARESLLNSFVFKFRAGTGGEPAGVL